MSCATLCSCPYKSCPGVRDAEQQTDSQPKTDPGGKERGAMILLASHNKEDIQILADQVYRISAGVVSQSEERLQ